MESTVLVPNGSAVSNQWQMLFGTEPIPENGRVIVSLDRWRNGREELEHRDQPVGVRLPNDAPIEDLVPALLERPLLVLDFPSFADGRGYSQARHLRRSGYKGDLRATGAAVVLDQIKFMQQCGISSFDLRSDQDARACAAILQAQKSIGGNPDIRR